LDCWVIIPYPSVCRRCTCSAGHQQLDLVVKHQHHLNNNEFLLSPFLQNLAAGFRTTNCSYRAESLLASSLPSTFFFFFLKVRSRSKSSPRRVYAMLACYQEEPCILHEISLALISLVAIWPGPQPFQLPKEAYNSTSQQKHQAVVRN